jgi:hypothetical protein
VHIYACYCTLQGLASHLCDAAASGGEAVAYMNSSSKATKSDSRDVLQQQQQQPKRCLRQQDYNSEDADFIEDDIGGMYNQV